MDNEATFPRVANSWRLWIEDWASAPIERKWNPHKARVLVGGPIRPDLPRVLRVQAADDDAGVAGVAGARLAPPALPRGQPRARLHRLARGRRARPGQALRHLRPRPHRPAQGELSLEESGSRDLNTHLWLVQVAPAMELPDTMSRSLLLGCLGMPGLSAYFGLM